VEPAKLTPDVEHDAPEVVAGQEYTEESDVWRLGVLLFKAATSVDNAPVALGTARVPVHAVQHPRLRDLLTQVLVVDPTERLSAQECAIHPYFTSFVRDMVDAGNYTTSDDKIAQFREYLARQPESGDLFMISVTRASMADDAIRLFSRCTPRKLRHDRLHVTFRGEAGVDAGGVTKDFFCSFFTAIMDPRLGLFETKNGKTFLPMAEPHFGRGRGGVTNELRQRHSAWELTLRKLEAVGRVLGKAVQVQVTVPDLFPPSFFKHLVGHEPRGLEDLEAFDAALARQLRDNVLAQNLTPEIAEALTLDFEGLKPGGGDVLVTNENKHEYVTLRANQTLVGCRRAALEAVSRGFQCMGFHGELRRFNGHDLRTLICGSTLVTPQLVLESVELDTPEWRRSNVPRFIRAVLSEMAEEDLRRFLRFVTGSPCLPHGGLGHDPNNPRIRFNRLPTSTRLPQAHTCFNTVDMPSYASVAVLKDKLLQAIRGVEEEIGLA